MNYILWKSESSQKYSENIIFGQDFTGQNQHFSYVRKQNQDLTFIYLTYKMDWTNEVKEKWANTVIFFPSKEN